MPYERAEFQRIFTRRTTAHVPPWSLLVHGARATAALPWRKAEARLVAQATECAGRSYALRSDVPPSTSSVPVTTFAVSGSPRMTMASTTVAIGPTSPI